MKFKINPKYEITIYRIINLIILVALYKLFF